MNIQEYQKLALRTESIVEKVEFNPTFVLSLFKLFALSGQALDTIKRDVYYRNPKKLEENLLKILAQLEMNLRIAKQEYANKDTKKDIPINPRVFHGITGMATESGELVEALIEGIENDGVIDPVNIHEEMHDHSWYEAITHEALQLDWAQGLENNINKLRVRFPDKFTEEYAANRDLVEERKVLESPSVSALDHVYNRSEYDQWVKVTESYEFKLVEGTTNNSTYAMSKTFDPTSGFGPNDIIMGKFDHTYGEGIFYKDNIK